MIILPVLPADRRFDWTGRRPRRPSAGPGPSPLARPFLDRLGIRESQLSEPDAARRRAGASDRGGRPGHRADAGCRVVGVVRSSRGGEGLRVLEPVTCCSLPGHVMGPFLSRDRSGQGDRAGHVGRSVSAAGRALGGAMFSLPEVGRRVDDWLEVSVRDQGLRGVQCLGVRCRSGVKV